VATTANFLLLIMHQDELNFLSQCLQVNDLYLLFNVAFFSCILTAQKSLCNGGEYWASFHGENFAGVLQA
jgi:hypothetical protein